MIEVRETSTYAKWFAKLADRNAKAASSCVSGACRWAILEMQDRLGTASRIDYGPGYRIYFLRHAATIVVLLAGGDKRTQDRDIAAAKNLARDWNRDDP